MKIIGITGGIGSGKTEVTHYLEQHYKFYVLLADEVANYLLESGQPCHEEIISLLGTRICNMDGEIDRSKMAEVIFSDKRQLFLVNQIIHPAVREYIVDQIESIRRGGRHSLLFIEAALLIEAGYEDIVDEFWYIYSDIGVRRERLSSARGYSDNKIDSIMKEQLSDEEFRKHCTVVIDNSGSFEQTKEQIDQKLGEYQ